MVMCKFVLMRKSSDSLRKVHSIPYKDGVAGSSPVPPTLRVKSINFHQKVQFVNVCRDGDGGKLC